MPRPRKPRPQDAVKAAQDVFWAQGHAASIDVLVAATGAPRASLYGDYGDKRGLFLAALDRYVEQEMTPRLTRIVDAADGRAGVLAFFHELEALNHRPEGAHGCFACNTLVELSLRDPAAARRAARHVHRLADAFAEALSRSMPKLTATDRAERAKALASTFVSASVLARTSETRAFVKPAIEEALRRAFDAPGLKLNRDSLEQVRDLDA